MPVHPPADPSPLADALPETRVERLLRPLARFLRVESAGGLRPALEAALASPVPALVDCPVDYAENDRLPEH